MNMSSEATAADVWATRRREIDIDTTKGSSQIFSDRGVFFKAKIDKIMPED